MYLSAGLFGVVRWWPHLNRLGRGVMIGIAGVIFLGVYFTLTRSVWLGAGLGLLLIIWQAIPKSWRVPMVVAMVLAGVPVLAMKWNKLNSFKRDANVSQHDMEQSVKNAANPAHGCLEDLSGLSALRLWIRSIQGS